MSKSTTVNDCGFTPFANGGCLSLLESTRMGSHPLVLQSREYIATFAESLWIYKFNECIPENLFIIRVLTKYLLVNAQ